MGGFLLVWHVFVAANVECIPEHQRAWLQGRLLHIGREFGLSHAQMLGMAERHILMHGDTPNLQAPNFSMVDPTTVGYSDLPPTMGAIGAGHFFTTAELGQRGQQWQRQWHGRVDEVMGGEETTEEARPQAPQMEKVTVQV